MAVLRPILAVLLAALLIWTPAAGAQDVYAAPTPEVIASWDVPELPADFETVHGPFVRFHGSPDDFQTLLHLSRYASDSLPRLATELGVPIGDTIHIVVAPDKGAFRELQPGNAPSWADGVAYPALGWIYLHAPMARNNTGTPLEKVLDHELIHVLLGRAFYPHPTPLWLQEGVAKVYAKEVTPETTRSLARGMVGSGLLSLKSLATGFPRDPVRAELAYAQSADFIGFLRVEYPGSLPRLIRGLARGEDIDSAIHGATGRWLEDVDAEWREGLEASSIPLSLSGLSVDGVVLGLGGVALVIGGLFRRRRFRERLAEMEAEEALVDELVQQIRRERAEAAIASEWQSMNGVH